MTEKKIRVMLRWMHIVSGLVIMCYIYSPFDEIHIFDMIVKWGIVPATTLTGIWIWQFRTVNKFLKINN